MKGIVTVDDIVDVVQEEATEDIQKFGGVEALDAPYLQIELPRMIRKRVGWLCVLFLGEMLTATAMGFFEKEIARAVVLALFIPLIISSGGNSGSQATTLVIRAMALGEVRLRDWWRVIRREFLAGLGLGLVLAVIGFLRIVLWEGLFHTYGPHYVGIAATVAFSLVGVVLWGTLAGSMLPVHPAAPGVRPRQRLGAVRGHAGRRERAGHLLHGRGGHPGGDVALTALGRGRAGRCRARAAAWRGLRRRAAPRPEPPRPRRDPTRCADTGCPPLPPISGFVGRGDGALLLDSVTPFRSTGTNLYYLQQLLSYAQQDQDPQALRGGAARCWTIWSACRCRSRASGASTIRRTRRRSAAAREEGFREEGLRGLDQAVWEAKRRGIRLILPLVNNWGEYGGLPAYAAWASAAFGGTLRARRLLHATPQMKQWWKDYALMLATG